MTAREEFDPKVVEAVMARHLFFVTEGRVREVLRTLRALGVLAGPGEVVVPQAAIDQAAADMFGSMKEGSTKETAKAAVRAYLRRMNALLAAAPRAVTEGGQ